jgi:hypothetical protein
MANKSLISLFFGKTGPSDKISACTADADGASVSGGGSIHKAAASESRNSGWCLPFGSELFGSQRQM